MTRANDDSAFLRLALAEAIKGTTSPNPHVGAVVLSPNGEIVGRGFHPRAGREHAEVMAIRAAGERARGGTLYVTLEPCNHHGRTPPCTDAIVAAGIERVVVGVRDPNPNVCGGGNAQLRAAGISVTELSDEGCERVIRPFAKHAKTGRPWVRLKLAASLDGRIAAATGVSKWITGPEARRRVHQTRAMVDAIAVGVGTALADDPSLTVRDVPAIEGHDPPVRVVIDSAARVPVSSLLVRTAREIPTRVVVAEGADTSALEQRGVLVTRVPRGADGVDLAAALDALGKLSIVDLLVEGGAKLAGALIAHDLVDEVQWYVAPIALGDRGVPSLIGPAPDDPGKAPRYAIETVERAGDDLAITLLRARA